MTEQYIRVQRQEIALIKIAITTMMQMVATDTSPEQLNKALDSAEEIIKKRNSSHV